MIYLTDNTFAPQESLVFSSPWVHNSLETTPSLMDTPLKLLQHQLSTCPTARHSTYPPACCLGHPYIRKSSVASHSTLGRFLHSPVPRIKQIHCLIKHNPSFFFVLTSHIYLPVSKCLRIMTSCFTYGEILLLWVPFWGTEWLH